MCGGGAACSMSATRAGKEKKIVLIFFVDELGR